MKSQKVALVAAIVSAATVVGPSAAWAQVVPFSGCPVLSEGNSEGRCVEELQAALNEANATYDLDEDGYFGEQTRIAVLDFQGRNGFGADGIVGQEVTSALIPFAISAVAESFEPEQTPGSPVIVSIGDSYSSGEGAGYGGSYDEGTDTDEDQCHRASTAWPRLIGVSESNHLACSGATSDNVINGGGNDSEGSTQIDRLALIEQEVARQGRHVDTVTLTIGGNDLGFSGIIGDCFKNNNCLAGFLEDNEQHMRELRDAVTRTTERIAVAAPSAEVLLIGYPRLVPSNDRPAQNCGWLTPRERERVNELADNMDSTLEALQLPNVRFVSTLDALSGHELCTPQSWIVPVQPIARNPDRPEQGHPIPEGQQAMASRVEAAIR